MATPVAVQIQPGQGPFCKNNFTVNFFVPFAYQADPVPATSPLVFISTFPPLCAYVKSYAGFGSDTKDIQKQYVALSKALEKDGFGDDYLTDRLYYGGYDSPFHLTHRHNEIWLIQKTKFRDLNIVYWIKDFIPRLDDFWAVIVNKTCDCAYCEGACAVSCLK